MNFPALNDDRKYLLLLTAAALVLAIAGLGNVALRDFDEGYYATTAQDTYLRGDWRFPTYLGQPFLSKPPLITWLVMGSYHLLGISEFSSRLPLALGSALAVPLLYLVGKEIFSTPKAALWSSSVLLTLLPTARLGRLTMLDGVINTCLLWSLFCLLKGRKQPHWLAGMGIGLGLIALAKGLLVLALTMLLGILILWLGAGEIFKRWQFWLGLAIGFAPVLWWYQLQFAQYGETFWQIHFEFHSFNRVTQELEGNTGPPWYYLLEIAKYTAPWLFFLVPAMVMTIKQWRQDWAKVAIIFGFGFLAIISAMGTKLPWYVLPCYPFFALMGGHYLADLQNRQRYPLLIGYLLAFTAGVGLVGGLYAGFTERRPVIIIMGLVLFVGVGWSARQYLNHSAKFVKTLVVSLYVTLLFLFSSPLWNWEVNEAFAVKPVGELIKQAAPVSTPVYTSFAYSRPSLDFYGDRQVIAMNDDQLRAMAKEGNYLLLDPEAQTRLGLPGLQQRGQAGKFSLFFSPKVGKP
ncbi:ArnT family glycosyltransferase [Synechocystis salina]|uniref:Glycosyltransferase family 39 protein n=1 Tax=Synechocystis salina LEGE 00031 TaxID=1828736 RepID=A0ABR9VMD6_9SYNC|nr:glycosyltransferase family 39 protein [Synechocystis salina]MBE9239776.1 glycosyltransferase family 39 protein [Synechocystis salina LEGE 00041]MBE9252511.1 glycosyltransferase family 39 protein [Synechocystis salina LEGE 00031]